LRHGDDGVVGGEHIMEVNNSQIRFVFFVQIWSQLGNTAFDE